MAEREWKLTYEIGGTQGAVFVTTITSSGALQLFRAKFPSAKVIWMEAAQTEAGDVPVCTRCPRNAPEGGLCGVCLEAAQEVEF